MRRSIVHLMLWVADAKLMQDFQHELRWYGNEFLSSTQQSMEAIAEKYRSEMQFEIDKMEKAMKKMDQELEVLEAEEKIKKKIKQSGS